MGRAVMRIINDGGLWRVIRDGVQVMTTTRIGAQAVVRDLRVDERVRAVLRREMEGL